MSKEPEPIEGDLDDVSYIEDVLWVYKHINNSVGEKKPGYTRSRKCLHDWATTKLKDGTMLNFEKFMKMAFDAEKARKTKKEESVQELGRKGLADLKATLAEMLEKAK